MSHTELDEVLRKAKELRIAGKDHAAIELLTQAIHDNPDARLYFSRGVQFDLTDRPEQAVADYTSAIQLDPANAKYYLNRGCILSHWLQKDKEAVCDFEKVLELEPNNVEAHRECCMCLLILGRPNSAWQHAIDALRLAPNDPPALFCVGEAHMSLGRFDDAIESLARAVELDPGQAHYSDALIRAREKQAEMRQRRAP